MENLSEVGILGCLLRNNESIVDIDLLPEHFENSSYSTIYESIREMISGKQPVDVITLCSHMNSATGRDWLAMITDIATNASYSVENVGAYCQAVKDRYQTRLCCQVGQWLIENSKDSSAVNESIKKLMGMTRESTRFEYGINEAMKIGLTAIKEADKNNGAMVGVPTGLNSLDEALGGLHSGDLIILGARPAMGKTSVLLNMVMGAQKSVGIFSGEQGIGQIVQRLISMESKISLMNMRNGKVQDEEWNRLAAGAHKIKGHPGVRFYDKPNPSIEEIESTARRWKFEFGVEAIYIDYLQKIKRDPKKNKIEAVGDNVSRLKDLARELEIPVLCLAQVKRDVENRTNRRPLMGDLSDSSEIEKEADQIIMIYRDEVYNENTQFPGIMELAIEKNRHGATGVVRANWDGRYLSISDVSRGGHDRV
jgi:replicative DNA helicase